MEITYLDGEGDRCEICGETKGLAKINAHTKNYIIRASICGRHIKPKKSSFPLHEQAFPLDEKGGGVKHTVEEIAKQLAQMEEQLSEEKHDAS